MSIKFRSITDDDLHTICTWPANTMQLFLFAPSAKYPLTFEHLKFIIKLRMHNTAMVESNRLMGFANFYEFKKGDYCFLGNVVICPKYRGEGLGKKLVLYMMSVAFDHYRFRELRLSVFEYNKPAYCLYRDLGFGFYDSEVRCDPNGKDVLLLNMKIDYLQYLRMHATT